MDFLPINNFEMKKKNIECPDFVLVSGDAYVDHPSFGAAIIGRLLESRGYSICILAQPDYNDLQSFKEFGCPKLAFLVTGGNIDSMVNHYTAAKKKRSKDLYSAGAETGGRPDRAAIVYSQKIRAAYKNVPIILGGIEASLRRLSHYDYWDDKVRRSILHDSGADILVYGMGESAIIEIASHLNEGTNIKDIRNVRGTAYKSRDLDGKSDVLELPEYNAVVNNKKLFAASFRLQYENTEAKTAKALAEKYDEGYVIQNPPMAPLSKEEMDKIYALLFMRTYHPIYEKKGGVPAILEVKFSLTSVRGCFGGCNFCALCFHQGRVVQPRSHESIVSEAEAMTAEPDFKGYIHDVGGPTANFRGFSCEKQRRRGTCPDRKCLVPKPCKNLEVSHFDYLSLLERLRKIRGVKKVFIRSGIRFDYLALDKDKSFFNALCKNHISGQLKVAPEHVSPRVLEKMGKPEKEIFDKFSKTFYSINEKLGLKQFLVPYLMSGHPGSTLDDAIMLALYLKKNNLSPEQVQDFYPTPATVSTCMYYTRVDPFTMEDVYVARNPHEKAMQRALIQYKLPQNYDLVYEALKKAKRLDLVGFGKDCLIRPKSGGAKPFAGVKGSVQKNEKKRKKRTIRNVHKKKG